MSGRALLNNNKGSMVDIGEGHPGRYMFLESTYFTGKNKVSNYGTHDWVADSALEIVAKSLKAKTNPRIVNWIRDVSINYAYLDKQGYVGRYNKYFVASNEQYWKKIGLSNEQWLRSRRKLWFLHGTSFPDQRVEGRSQITTNIINNLPDEYFKMRHIPWANKGKHHHVWIDASGELVDNQNLEAQFALMAAKDAIKWLNDKIEYKDTNGQTQERWGRYEPAAFCLGAMTHFVSDLASPPHTLKEYGWGQDVTPGKQQQRKNAHNNFERFIDNLMDPEFIESINGPDLKTLFGNQIYDDSKSLRLTEKNPGKAAEDLAMYVRNPNGDNFGHTQEYDPYYFYLDPKNPKAPQSAYIDFMKYALKRAVWETARAILWVLNRVDWDKHGSDHDNYDVVGRLWDDPKPTEPIGLPRYEPQSLEGIQSELRDLNAWTTINPPSSGGAVGATAISTALWSLAPLLSITLIAISPKIWEEFLSKSH